MPKYIVEAESIEDLLDGYGSVPSELVQCKDCNLCDCTNLGFMVCERTDQMTTSDGYCKWGVRI